VLQPHRGRAALGASDAANCVARGRAAFLRGLVKLGPAVVPMFGRGAAARPHERLLLAAAIAAPVQLLAVPAAPGALRSYSSPPR
jgi:hypothetical protein